MKKPVAVVFVFFAFLGFYFIFRLNNLAFENKKTWIAEQNGEGYYVNNGGEYFYQYVQLFPQSRKLDTMGNRFQAISPRIAKDDMTVWYLGEPIKDVDVGSYQVLTLLDGYEIGIDREHVFVANRIIMKHGFSEEQLTSQYIDDAYIVLSDFLIASQSGIIYEGVYYQYLHGSFEDKTQLSMLNDFFMKDKKQVYCVDPLTNSVRKLFPLRNEHESVVSTSPFKIMTSYSVWEYNQGCNQFN